ncbi:hypothetical protein ACFE04_015681 [Oxalis oulophora]
MSLRYHQLAIDGLWDGSITHLKRHTEKCSQKKIQLKQKEETKTPLLEPSTTILSVEPSRRREIENVGTPTNLNKSPSEKVGSYTKETSINVVFPTKRLFQDLTLNKSSKKMKIADIQTHERYGCALKLARAVSKDSEVQTLLKKIWIL